jgi:hypothetical protein
MYILFFEWLNENVFFDDGTLLPPNGYVPKLQDQFFKIRRRIFSFNFASFLSPFIYIVLVASTMCSVVLGSENACSQLSKICYLTRSQWLTPAFLVTQEAQIRKIRVWSQPRQIVHETLSQKNLSQKRTGGVTQMVQHLPCNPRGPKFKPQYCPGMCWGGILDDCNEWNFSNLVSLSMPNLGRSTNISLDMLCLLQ